MMKTVIYKKQATYDYSHCKHTHMPYPNPINIIRSRGLVTTTPSPFHSPSTWSVTFTHCLPQL